MVVNSTYVGPSITSGGTEELRNRVNTVESDLDTHTSNTSNPHGVDDSQTGAASALNSHASDTSNPHGVDDSQTGAASALDSHASDTSNPHGVTAGQTGAATQTDIDNSVTFSDGEFVFIGSYSGGSDTVDSTSGTTWSWVQQSGNGLWVEYDAVSSAMPSNATGDVYVRALCRINPDSGTSQDLMLQDSRNQTQILTHNGLSNNRAVTLPLTQYSWSGWAEFFLNHRSDGTGTARTNRNITIQFFAKA